MQGNATKAILAIIFLIIPGRVSADNNEASFVCAEVNQETGECDAWREITHNQRPSNQNPYQGDYLYPPGHPRLPKRTVIPLGSSIMPNGAYAPGLGTSHKPIWEKGPSR